eukprot:TRINITY_DN6988_c0_g1_i2.p1 TRINITY_DN6988_c0_g1~~TRINITY_DN6988_c0_g1_i2.p1  ORF type:complete len:476 (+),score=22.16 TRINITY_DN6988_c0_g1_i2:64-1491(+)
MNKGKILSFALLGIFILFLLANTGLYIYVTVTGSDGLCEGRLNIFLVIFQVLVIIITIALLWKAFDSKATNEFTLSLPSFLFMFSSSCLIILSSIYIIVIIYNRGQHSFTQCLPSLLERATTIIDIVLQMMLLILVPSFVWVPKNSVYWYIYICLVLGNLYWSVFDIWNFATIWSEGYIFDYLKEKNPTIGNIYKLLIFPLAVTFRLDSFVRLCHKHPTIDFAEQTFITGQTESENEDSIDDKKFTYVNSENAPLLSGYPEQKFDKITLVVTFLLFIYVFMNATLGLMWVVNWNNISFVMGSQVFIAVLSIFMLVSPGKFGLKRKLGFTVRPEEDAQVSFYEYNWQSALISVSFLVFLAFEIAIYFVYNLDNTTNLVYEIFRVISFAIANSCQVLVFVTTQCVMSTKYSYCLSLIYGAFNLCLWVYEVFNVGLVTGNFRSYFRILLPFTMLYRFHCLLRSRSHFFLNKGLLSKMN